MVSDFRRDRGWFEAAADLEAAKTEAQEHLDLTTQSCEAAVKQWQEEYNNQDQQLKQLQEALAQMEDSARQRCEEEETARKLAVEQEALGKRLAAERMFTPDA